MEANVPFKSLQEKGKLVGQKRLWAKGPNGSQNSGNFGSWVGKVHDMARVIQQRAVLISRAGDLELAIIPG